MTSLFKNFSIAVCVLMLSGCSFSFVYNKLDWWINWYLDDYVELNKTQQKSFDKAFEELHLWHRQNELMRYHEQLSSFKARVNAIEQDQPITEQEIYQFLVDSQQHWHRFITHAQPYLTTLLAELSAEQKEALINNLKKRNEKLLADRAETTLEERVKDDQKSQQKSFKKWFGKLSKAQKTLVDERVTTYQSSFDQWLAYRNLWLSSFESALMPTFDQQVNEQLLIDAIINAQDLRSEAFIEKIEYNNRVFSSLLADFLNQASKKQMKRFNRRVTSYLEDFEDLSKDN